MTLRAVESALCGAETPPQIYNSNNNERSQSRLDDWYRGSLAESFEKHLTDENVTEQVRREGGYSAGSGRDIPKFIPAKTDLRNPDEHFEQSEMSRDESIAAASERIHGRISLGRKSSVGGLRDELDTPFHQDRTHAQHMAAGQRRPQSYTTTYNGVRFPSPQLASHPQPYVNNVVTTLNKCMHYLKEDAVHSCREVTVSEYSSTFTHTSTTCHEQPVDREAIVQVDDVGKQGLLAQKFSQETKPNEPSMERLTGTGMRQKQGTIVQKQIGDTPKDVHVKDQADTFNLTRSGQETWIASNFKVRLSDWRKAWEERPGVRKTLQRWKELRSKGLENQGVSRVLSTYIHISKSGKVNSENELMDISGRGVVIDTGSPANCINEAALKGTDYEHKIKRYTGRQLQGLAWWAVRPKGIVTLKFKFEGTELTQYFEADFLVIRERLQARFDCLLGWPWLEENDFELVQKREGGIRISGNG